MSKRMITVKEAAVLTRYKEDTFRRIFKGRYPYYIEGGRILFDEDELLRVMHSNRIPSSAELVDKHSGIGY